MNDVDPPSAQDRRILFGTFFIATIAVISAIFVSVGFYEGIIKSNPNQGVISSRRTSSALVSAVNFYQSEFEKIPEVGNRVTTNSPEGLKLLKILLGREDKSDTAQNPKGIKFLDVMEGKNNRNGLIYSADGKSIEGLYDPWGSPYTVILDTENKEHLHFSLGSRTIDLPGRRAAVISPGKDKMIGTADDLRTW